MIKRYHKQHKQEDISRSYRVNERIFAQEVRVLDNESRQVGVMQKSQALSKARETGLDLVEIAPNAKPPVVKIVDFRKFVYQLEKKKREEKRKTKLTETKEIRLGPFMSENDIDVMANRGKGFIEDGNNVKFVVKLSGRENAHPEFGFKVLDKIVEKLSDIAKVEREAKKEIKQISLIMSPDRKSKG